MDQALEHFQVRACLDGPLPDALVAHAPDARSYLEQVAGPRSTGGKLLPVRGNRIRLDGLVPGDCLEYAVSLPRSFHGGWRSGAHRVGDSLIVSPLLWLWYPYRGNAQQPFRLTLQIPEGMQLSVPWPRAKDAAESSSYRLGARPYEWQALVAFGPASQEAVTVNGATLRITLLAGAPAADQAALTDWIRQGAEALTMLYGRFPVPEAQVLVVPIGQGDEPVPWGQVTRGGGDAVHLFIDQRQPMTAFRRDWTLMHELSHLLHPMIDNHTPWLNEGLASYYQNVLRASSGVVSPEQAWEELDAGFQRGRQDSQPEQSLAEVGENMRSNRRFMRVYWSGAAIMLMADTELRARSGGRQSLASALQAFRECCLPSDRGWSALEFLRQLDRLTESDVFTGLYARYAYSSQFPDLRAIYSQLGLRREGTGLHFAGEGSAARLRAEIMQSATRPN